MSNRFSTFLSAVRLTFQKYAPFVLHLTLTAAVATVFLLVLDGRAFNTNSRRPQYMESDGSVSHLKSYAPLQSDITTAVSLAATATRVAAGWWGGGYIWRCIFVSMERGGISLDGLSKAVSNMPPARRHFARKSNMVIISIALFFTYAIDYFSAALTGSITWEAEDRIVLGSVPITGIQRGVTGANLTNYYAFPDYQSSIVAIGTASANLAWVAIQPNSSNITEPSTNSRRVLNKAGYLPVNSTLDKITMPYFTVDAFEWIKDPDGVLTNVQIPLFTDFSEFSPWLSVLGTVGLLPESKWGPPQANTLGDPQIMSESRLLAFRVERRPWQTGPCQQNYAIDPGSQVNLHEAQHINDSYDCFAIANVTYRAGAATCTNCKLISPTVLETAGPITPIPDAFTSMALGLAPSLGTWLTFSGYAVPRNSRTNRTLAIELTSRAYQAAWAAYSDSGMGSQVESTDVRISLPRLRAKVIAWRVYLWVALHMCVLVLGLLFIYIQSRCEHPWSNDPTMAVFWLDTSAVANSLSSKGSGIDPWLPGAKLPINGMLTLQNAGQVSRSVKLE